MDGDLFIGFHSAAATNEYLWDLGPYTQFDGKPIGYQAVVGNIQADLTAVFGANWGRDVNVQWGSAGTLDAASRVFSTKAEPGMGVFASPWQRQSTSSQNFTGSQIDTMVFGDFAGQEATTNNPNAVVHNILGLSWASFNDGVNSPGGSFGTWVPTIEAPQIPGVPGGIGKTRLDLFRIDPDNSGTNPPAEYIGTFRMDNLGNVLYQVFDTRPPSITKQPKQCNNNRGANCAVSSPGYRCTAFELSVAEK